MTLESVVDQTYAVAGKPRQRAITLDFRVRRRFMGLP